MHLFFNTHMLTVATALLATVKIKAGCNRSFLLICQIGVVYWWFIDCAHVQISPFLPSHDNFCQAFLSLNVSFGKGSALAIACKSREEVGWLLKAEREEASTMTSRMFLRAQWSLHSYFTNFMYSTCLVLHLPLMVATETRFPDTRTSGSFVDKNTKKVVSLLLGILKHDVEFELVPAIMVCKWDVSTTSQQVLSATAKDLT